MEKLKVIFGEDFDILALLEKIFSVFRSILSIAGAET